ncbi:MAG TPA: M56 family metallopeptidase, partial [Saprospiraceae bacterium]|nr:M56 family metallopeptidase [Saprospiraceae bacterium]
MNQLNFLQSLGWALINSLWQMALLWIIYQLIIGIMPRMKAGNKASLATILSVGGFFWFVYTLIFSLLSGNIAPEATALTGIVNESTWDNFAGKLLPFAAFIYLIILALPVWQFIRNYHFVQVIRTTGLKKPDANWRIFVRNTAASMGIVKKVQIWLSEKVSSPVTIGFLKPIILIPIAAMNNLTPAQLEAIILHELRHIHRYDYLFNLVIIFIKTILYFNP